MRNFRFPIQDMVSCYISCFEKRKKLSETKKPFMKGMKDKTHTKKKQIVLHQRNEGQNQVNYP